MKRSIQTYECRLRRSRVLKLADVGGVEQIGCAEVAARAGHALIRGVPHEQVWVLLMNGKNEVIGAIRLGEGGLHGCALRPADVLRPVLLAAASGFVLIHNHPSGDPTPSQVDRDLTRTLWQLCEMVGVYLLDHVIVTQNAVRWHSMGAQGDD